MKLNELKPALGSVTAPKRLGRGIGSGLGKTSGKGGQMPLTRRLPKRGFTNIFATEYAIVNVSKLDMFEDGAVVGAKELIEAGLIKKELDGVKILGNGDLTKKLTVRAAKFTGAAKEKIEALGGIRFATHGGSPTFARRSSTRC